MRIVQDLSEPSPTQDTLLTIGAFDGIHIGHQSILHEIVQRARKSNRLSGMVTFDPHPRQVLFPEEETELLTTPEEKTDLVREVGVDLLILLPFTQELADTSAQDFVEALHHRMRMRALWVGKSFRLGRGGEGDIQRLQELGEHYGFQVHAVDPVVRNGQPVSSTYIRSLLKTRQVAEAAQLLGRRYTVSGEIVRGAGRGRQLGFPTANLQPPPQKLIPGHGVYVGCIEVEGAPYHAVVNIGVRPSFDNGHPTIEAHLLDFDGDLYGHVLSLEFIDFLRHERPFSSPEALIEQIQRDCARARKMLCHPAPG